MSTLADPEPSLGRNSPEPLGRNSLLALLAVFAGLTIVVVLVSTIAGALERAAATPEPTLELPAEPVAPPGPEADVLAFLGPLARGEAFEGWVIERIDPRREGAILLALLGPEARRVEVELRAIDERSPSPPAASATLAIYVRGRESSDETLAGLRALADALRIREASGPALAGLEPLPTGP